jgi:hypothetical protein
VSCLEDPSTRRTSCNRLRSLGYGGVLDSMSGLYEAAGLVMTVARFRVH